MTTNGKRPKIYAIVNRKGGVGKTTTAITLAHGLSRRLLSKVSPEDRDKTSMPIFEYGGQDFVIRGHVLLIDLDPQGHCASGLGLKPEGADIGELLAGRQTIQEAVVSADRSDDGLPRPNLWLIPASDNLAKVKIELIGQSLSQMLMGGSGGSQGSLVHVLEDRLKLAIDRFSYIIIDCPPTLDALATAVYQFADAAIVPVKPDYLSTSGAGQHLTEILSAQSAGIKIQVHTIVPTFTVERQKLDQEMLEVIKTTYGQHVLADPIPRSQKVAEAPAYHQTLFEFDLSAESPATVAYESLVTRIYHG